MSYVDGYLLPVPKDKIDAYREIADTAGKIWMEHGALSYKECVMDDDNIHNMLSFTTISTAKENETTIFAFVVFKSRAHRDEVNAKVMSDPRLKCDENNTPFDMKRMAYGGFKPIVDY